MKCHFYIFNENGELVGGALGFGLEGLGFSLQKTRSEIDWKLMDLEWEDDYDAQICK